MALSFSVLLAFNMLLHGSDDDGDCLVVGDYIQWGIPLTHYVRCVTKSYESKLDCDI